MATRNLTKKFVDIRNAAKANRALNVRSTFELGESDSYSDREQLRPPGASSSTAINIKSALPPRWVEEIDRLEETISSIQLRITDLEKLHTKRLMVTFDTDDEEKEKEINAKTREITNLFRDAELMLKKFSSEERLQALEPADVKVRQNIQRAVAKRLQGLSMSFRRSQKEYMGKLKSQTSEASGGGVFDIAEPARKTGVLDFHDEGFNQRQQQLVIESEENARLREEEIANIAKSIEELAQIFRELAVLVIDQGTILDRIDYNMETAVEHAKVGIQELHKAEDHQKNNPGLKCIIVLVILIFILMIVLIVKHSKR